MIDRFDLIQNKEETREFIELSNWAYHSHWWVELSPGYCECKWCGKKQTSTMGISKDYPLCKENYAIKRLISASHAMFGV